MPPFTDKIAEVMHSRCRVAADDSFVVAVSGGPDSICLLDVLARSFPRSLKGGVYVDHRLRPDEAAAERTLVKAMCADLSVPFYGRSIDAAAAAEERGDSVEAAGRRLRYTALDEARREAGADLVAVGHTSDDQVEELLLRLIRGSGLKGLSGMAYRHGTVIRPLLATPKDDVLAYLSDRGLSFCRDSTNESRRFLRNRVRLDLVPLLERDFNPAIRRTILQTMAILQEEEAYLDAEAEHHYARLVEHGVPEDEAGGLRLDCTALLDLPTAMGRRVVEKLCWRAGSRPSYPTIEAILELAGSATSGAELHLADRLRVVRDQKTLLAARLAPGQPDRDPLHRRPSLHVQIPGPGRYLVTELGLTLIVTVVAGRVVPAEAAICLDADLAGFPLLLRPPRPGERLRPLNAPGTKTVARLLSDAKIPRHRRHRYPVICSGDDILGVLGLTVGDEFKITPATGRSLLIDIER